MTRVVRAMRDKILAEMVDKPGEKKTAGGIIITENDGQENAVRPRWFKVYSVGSDIDWITKGKYVLVDHGRWSNRIQVNDDLRLYLLDNKDCLLESETNPLDNGKLQVTGKVIPKRPSGDITRG